MDKHVTRQRKGNTSSSHSNIMNTMRKIYKSGILGKGIKGKGIPEEQEAKERPPRHRFTKAFANKVRRGRKANRIAKESRRINRNM